jgi:hypothetical protein
MTIDNERPVSNGFIKDVDLELKDAGLVASSAAAQVDASDQILDLGLGRVDADVIIDATAVEVDTGDELYTIICEFSNSSTFASGIVPGSMQYLGDAAAIPGGGDTDNVEGRYKLPFTNVVNDTHYRYMRLYTVVAGTIATGVNYSANIAIR